MNLLDLTAAQLGVAPDDPRFKALMAVYQAALDCGVYCISDADPPVARAVAKLLPDTVLVIDVQALDPDPLPGGALSSSEKSAPPPPVPPPPPPPEPVRVQPMLALPAPEKPRDLPSVAAGSGYFAVEDGPPGSGLWLIYSGKSVLFCGTERGARQFLEDRAARPVHRRTPLGSR
jgi:hypothetical protein